jgi:hypothetical protein
MPKRILLIDAFDTKGREYDPFGLTSERNVTSFQMLSTATRIRVSKLGRLGSNPQNTAHKKVVPQSWQHGAENERE